MSGSCLPAKTASTVRCRLHAGYPTGTTWRHCIPSTASRHTTPTALATPHDSQLAIVTRREFNNLTYRRLGPMLASLFRALGESEVDADSMRFAGGAHARSRRPAADGCPSAASPAGTARAGRHGTHAHRPVAPHARPDSRAPH